MDATCTILANGDLKITISDEDRDELHDAIESEQGFWSIMAELFEHYACNGSYEPFDAADGNPFVGLTGAPCIAERMDVDDDGERTIDGEFWYFGDYMIADPLEELEETGEVIFTLARE